MSGSVNITSIKTSSNGVWQGDDPLHFAFPLLILQTILILLVSRLLSFLLKPLRQPNVIAEIIGGIILGPSALGRNKTYLHAVFPAWSTPILESAASIGLLFFLFLVGLELDLRSIRRSGRRAFAIAAAGISLPFACGVGVAFVVRRAIPGAGASEGGYAAFLVFMGVALSITAFPVLARILAELKLLTAPLGEVAMAAAAFNDVAAWVLLALAVAVSGDRRSPAVSAYVLLSGVAFVAAGMGAVRPAMEWVARRAAEGGEGEALWISLTLAGVLVSGFLTDLIGIHAIFGAFVFGLAVPKHGPFAERLTERIEDFVSGLLLPLYFASSGLKTDVATIRGGTAWALLAMVIATACAGKILGTFVVAMACRMSAKDSITLGVLMNTKGLVLNDETFTILVLMALFTTFITTPTLMAIYKPARRSPHHHHRKLRGSASPSSPCSSSSYVAADPKELRVLACVRGDRDRDVPSLVRLIETLRGRDATDGKHRCSRSLKLYILRLLELTERPSSIIMARTVLRNGLPFLPRRRPSGDHIAVAFGATSRVRGLTAVSSLATMHEDVCAVAGDKRITLLLVLFHKHRADSDHHRRHHHHHHSSSEDGSDDDMESVGQGWRTMTQRILKEAPCSVGVLVDRGFGSKEQTTDEAYRVCVVFFGGPDDREALELAGRMAEHPRVRVTVVRFITPEKDGEEKKPGVTLRPSQRKSSERSYTFSTADVDREREKELDEAAIAEFRQKTEGAASYEERSVTAGNVVEAVLAIGRSGNYELMVVGKGQCPSAMVAELAGRPAEHPELGPIGDALASGRHGIGSSVLVIQQHNSVHSEETPVSVVFDGDAATAADPPKTLPEP
ncbi:Cation/H(+) antiporter 20 [Ananas comosus]|uniref:Cation/H(+) antiporter 20 n=1 Tax=Ananas comosus TaxID=4615 RepID=A0A199V548_ANACO|nr:Cation/H(+) antiporter 20 [Ananas comosus]